MASSFGGSLRHVSAQSVRVNEAEMVSMMSEVRDARPPGNRLSLAGRAVVGSSLSLIVMVGSAALSSVVDPESARGWSLLATAASAVSWLVLGVAGLVAGKEPAIRVLAVVVLGAGVVGVLGVLLLAFANIPTSELMKGW